TFGTTLRGTSLSDCQACPIGTYNADVGRTACSPCPPGYASTAGGLSDVEECAVPPPTSSSSAPPPPPTTTAAPTPTTSPARPLTTSSTPPPPTEEAAPLTSAPQPPVATTVARDDPPVTTTPAPAQRHAVVFDVALSGFSDREDFQCCQEMLRSILASLLSDVVSLFVSEVCDLSGCTAAGGAVASGAGRRRLAQAGTAGMLAVRFSGSTLDDAALSSTLEARSLAFAVSSNLARASGRVTVSAILSLVTDPAAPLLPPETERQVPTPGTGGAPGSSGDPAGGLSSADMVVVGCAAALVSVALGGVLLLWRARRLRKAAGHKGKKGSLARHLDESPLSSEAAPSPGRQEGDSHTGSESEGGSHSTQSRETTKDVAAASGTPVTPGAALRVALEARGKGGAAARDATVLAASPPAAAPPPPPPLRLLAALPLPDERLYTQLYPVEPGTVKSSGGEVAHPSPERNWAPRVGGAPRELATGERGGHEADWGGGSPAAFEAFDVLIEGNVQDSTLEGDDLGPLFEMVCEEGQGGVHRQGVLDILMAIDPASTMAEVEILWTLLGKEEGDERLDLAELKHGWALWQAARRV
ncbi:hypothetical protein T484DRAFT_1822348, partial [Baffinella frigidus]